LGEKGSDTEMLNSLGTGKFKGKGCGFNMFYGEKGEPPADREKKTLSHLRAELGEKEGGQTRRMGNL